MPTYNYNPPQKETINNVDSNKNNVAKYRIYNIFKPTIVLDELSMPFVEGDSKTNRTEDFTGLQYPLIKINNYFLGESEIDSMTIDSNGFLPQITLTVTFSNELFFSKEMPKDGDIISIFIRNKSDILTPIRNDYVIKGVPSQQKSTTSNSPITLTFFGELFVPGLKSYIGSNSFKGTSMEVLKKTAQLLLLGFNTNENNTDDKQLWYITNTPEDFIHDICKKSWKDENSFFDVWIDIYYNLNFVNVQKQLLSSEDDVDIAALLGNVDKGWTWGTNTNENNTVETPKVFSNYIGYRTSSFYITTWKPINKSTSITFKYGTSMYSSFYEHNNKLYLDGKEKYWNFKVDPIYDKEKITNHILLRGRTTYDPSINNDELARANYNYNDIYKKTPWLGIQYTISNPNDDNLKWDGNQHANYLRAKTNNLLNLVELDKLNVEIYVQGTNLNIVKGDKLPIVLIKKDPIEVKLIHKDKSAIEALEFFYSGWYYVKGFNIIYIKSDNNLFSNFSQSFLLARREWPTPEPINNK